MKKLLLLSLSILFLASCKDETTSNHQDSHSVQLSIDVSNAVNIGSLNIYMNDDIVGQMSAAGTHDRNMNYIFKLEQGITQHPMALNFSVEPMFLDSSEARGDISVNLLIDEEKQAETPLQPVVYGGSVRLSHTVE